MRRPAISKPAPPADNWPPPTWLLAALLALVTVALYWPALQHDFVNYDDDRYITGNVAVQRGLNMANLKWAFVTPVADNWHPVTVLSNMLLCQWCGIKPWGHHLANVLLHAANAALVLSLLRRWTGATWRSFFVAALFAVHPLRVESVAWIAERKDVLSGFFGLLTLIFYTRYAQTSATRPAGRFLSSPAYWLALFCFALGLMSKPMLVTWPFVLLLLDYWPLGRIPNSKFQISSGKSSSIPPTSLVSLGLEKVPFLLLAAAAGVLTFLVQQRGAAVETIQNLPLTARVGNAVVSYCRYLEKTFWPVDLSVLYPHPGYWPTTTVILAGVFLLGLSLLFVRQRHHPYLLVGWLWFIGTLVPVLGLVQVGLQSMADRYTYLPSLGVLIVIVWGISELARRWQQPGRLLAAGGAAAVIVCMTLTRQQLAVWQDGETLFRHALAVTQNNYVARYNLGGALDQKHRTADAIDQYQSVIALKPDFAKAHAALGSDLDEIGRTDDAMREDEEAIRLDPDNASAHNNLGVVLSKSGRDDEAIFQYREALRRAPSVASTHNNLAAALYHQGQPDESIREFQEAINLKPDYVEARFNLANVLAKKNRTAEAISQYQEVVRLNPNYANARDKLAQLLQAQSQ